MSIGHSRVEVLRDSDIIQRQGTLYLTKSYGRFYIYRSNEYGYYNLVTEGTLLECAQYLANS